VKKVCEITKTKVNGSRRGVEYQGKEQAVWDPLGGENTKYFFQEVQET